jgi:hypothetical protein
MQNSCESLASRHGIRHNTTTLLLLLIKFNVYMQPFGYDRPIQESVIGKPIAPFIIPGPLTLMSPSPFTPTALIQ